MCHAVITFVCVGDFLVYSMTLGVIRIHPSMTLSASILFWRLSFCAILYDDDFELLVRIKCLILVPIEYISLEDE